MSATDQPLSSGRLDQLEGSRDETGAKRYLRLEGEPKPVIDLAEGPRPLEYDANGFPVPQHNSSFVKRVARLVDPL